MNRLYQFMRRHARAVARDQLCPARFYLLGGRVFDPEQSYSGVEVYCTAPRVERHFPLQQDVLSGRRYAADTVRYPPAYVLRMDAQRASLRVLGNGAVSLGERTLAYAGLHPSASMLAMHRSKSAVTRQVETLVLPWAHPWYTFGDFMTTILPLIARIRSQMEGRLADQAYYALPGLASRPWVADFLSLLGIDAAQLIDLDKETPGLTGEGQLFTAMGLPRYGVTAHPHDVETLRAAILPAMTPETAGSLYVPRSHGRCLEGEAAMLPALREAGYRIVPEGLSAREQAALFMGARVIAGPHGGAFGNLIFSQSAAFFEFQHPRWMVPCFRHLADFVGSAYHLTLDEAASPSYRAVHGYAQGALHLPIPQLQSALLALQS